MELVIIVTAKSPTSSTLHKVLIHSILDKVVIHPLTADVAYMRVFIFLLAH